MQVASVKTLQNDELHLYLNLLKHKHLNDYNEIINILRDMFNVTVTLEQLEEYYSPNASEIEEDLRLQFKHLGLV